MKNKVNPFSYAEKTTFYQNSSIIKKKLLKSKTFQKLTEIQTKIYKKKIHWCIQSNFNKLYKFIKSQNPQYFVKIK